MNKLLILVALLLMLLNTNAQNIAFEKLLPPSESKSMSFMGLDVGISATADIDNDEDLDVIIVGANDNGHHTTVLYENDGNGNFTIVNDTPFEGARSGSVEFADVDNDNDMDVIIAGQKGDLKQYTNLYKNDGLGNFTLVENTPFEASIYGSINFADVDSDKDLDVLITGEGLAKLYINDGLGNYTESIENVFTPAKYGMADVADVDGDSDLDFIIVGDDDQYIAHTKLYINDGHGLFTEDVNVSSVFEPVSFSSVCFGDADNDLDADVILCGYNNSHKRVTRLYLNDGSGSYTLDANNTFDDVAGGAVFFSDFDNDNDMDIYLSGASMTLGKSYSEIYENHEGTFNKVITSPFDLKTDGTAIAADIDGDDDLDIITNGSGDRYTRSRYVSQFRTTVVFLNEGNMDFRRVQSSSIDNFSNCAFDYADIDADSDLDIVIAGQALNGICAKVYTNDGDGNYAEKANFDINGHRFNGSVNLADIDGDNDNDLLITGTDSDSEDLYSTVLYTNKGNGEFQSVNNRPFVGVVNSTSTFFDMDNDNDLDLLITGKSESKASDVRLYKNNGTGEFTEETNTTIEGVSGGSVAYADIDGDNDIDLVIGGSNCVKRDEYNTSCQYTINIYTNDGLGNFSKVPHHTLPVVNDCSIQFGDIDNDGDQDLLLTGKGTYHRKYATIFKNNGSGSFTEDTSISFEGVDNSSVSFGNINNDDYIDILINGQTVDYREITNLYQNDGHGGFFEVETVIMDGSSNGCVSFIDADNDGDDDVLTSGSGFTALYRNITESSIVTGFDTSENNTATTDCIMATPNPTKGNITIHLNCDERVSIQVFNLLGAVCYEDNDVIAENYKLKINGAPGMYYIKISSEHFKKTIKVMKE